MKPIKTKKILCTFLSLLLCITLFSTSVPAYAESVPQESPAVSDEVSIPEESAPFEGTTGAAAANEPPPNAPVNLTPQASIALSDLSVDGREATSVNSDARTVSGSLTISGGEASDWYYQSITGEQGVLYSLKFDGGFHDSSVTKLAVDEQNPAVVHFSFEVRNTPMRMDGILSVMAANNCYGMDLSVTVPVNVLTVGGTIAVDDPGAREPSYTITGAVTGGVLQKSIEPADLAFDGVFAQASVSGVTANAGEATFTVKITKKTASAALGAHGSMTLSPGIFQYPDGSACGVSFSLDLVDEFEAKEAGAGAEKPAESHAGLYHEVAKEITEIVLEVGVEVIKALTEKDIFGALGILKVIDVGIFAGMSTESTEIKEALSDIASQIDRLSADLDASTLRIISSVGSSFRKNDLATAINDFGASADKLDVQYYSYYNDKLAAIAADMQVGRPLYESQVKTLQSVYSSEHENHKYLDKFRLFVMKITGEGAVLNKADIFQTNQALESYIHNWNSQTFAQREQFNETVLAFYYQGYTTLLTAVQYDYEVNMQAVNSYQAWLDVALREWENKTDADGNALSAEYLDELNARIKDCQKQIQSYKGFAQDANKALKQLNDLNSKVQKAYKKASDDLEGEKYAFETEKKVFSYRLDRCMPAQLLGQHNINGFEGTYPGATDSSDMMALYNTAFERGLFLYDDLMTAGFIPPDRPDLTYIWTGKPHENSKKSSGFLWLTTTHTTKVEAIVIASNEIIPSLTTDVRVYKPKSHEFETNMEGFICVNTKGITSKWQ